MQTLKHGFEECNPTMVTVAEELVQYWRSRLDVECPQLGVASRESIIHWLLASYFQRY